jgi:hypothetical protein
MTILDTAVILGLLLFSLASQFLSDAAPNPRRKFLWRRAMQVSYGALLVLLAIKLVPLARPIIEKMLAAQ